MSQGTISKSAPLSCRPFGKMRWLLATLLVLCAFMARAQNATVSGVVRDEVGQPVPGVSVSVVGAKVVATTDENGHYELSVPPSDPPGTPVVFHFDFLKDRVERSLVLAPGERTELSPTFRAKTIAPVQVTNERLRDAGITKLDPKVTRFMPNPLGDVNALLQGQLGVATRNELSSGYSVRGGNFDENLVYVNDIEVYRPFLVRAGQQEGLSFPNPDMIEKIHFSAGGFEARYGDKLSSVLDITYKRPREFAGSASASFMGGSLHLESPMLNKRLRQVTGFRYRTLSALLSGLDTQGDYTPVYTDLQTYWTYDLSDKVELGFLGVYSRNKYDVVPTDRETELGNFNEALRFTVYFEGQEKTAYETFFGALNVNVKPKRDMLLKFTGSAFRTYETERFDVLGQYRLSELDRDLGSDDFGQPIKVLGVGTYLDHARNQLQATVFNVTHKGTWRTLTTETREHEWRWGVEARSESIDDRLSEWYMVDSADYSIPYTSDPEKLELQRSVKSHALLNSLRTSAYVQHAWDWHKGNDRSWALVAGVRAQNWSYNEQTIVSPRVRLAYHPGWKKVTEKGDTLDRDYSFWLASGLYYQAPFYRELRNMNGQLNPELRAQRSIHFILGADRQFKWWDRPFKVTGEAYYKVLDDLVPYELDNVRIRYYAKNNARGYAAGLDVKLNGEFIKGVESWAALSVMQTEEDLIDDYYYRRFNAAGEEIYPGYTFDSKAVDSVRVNPGYIPRPTDQRVNFALFFQDEMPNAPTFKVHLSLFFGTSLPYGPPNSDRYGDTLRTNLYRRVDVGFSKQLLGAKGQTSKGIFKGVKDAWVSLEVFNLINLNNTVDFSWVQDVSGRYYGIPEFLTPRRFNLKLIAWF